MNLGKFITIEGGDGAGKSTQSNYLYSNLKKKGINVIKTREPGGCPESEGIRELLVTGEPNKWSPLTETLLHCASRSSHLKTTIIPKLESGGWVICDRFCDSTLVYQGYAGKVNLETIHSLNKIIVNDFVPDYTIIIDVPVDIGLSRASKRGNMDNRYEKMDFQFHEKIRNGFLELAKTNLDRYAIVNGELSENEIEKCILDKIEKKFKI